MKKVLLLCIGLNLAFESCTLKAVEKYCPFLKTSNTDTALMVAGVAGGFLASRLVKSAWRRLTTEFPIKPEHQYTYFSDQQLKIMQQSPLQRFKRNALETFTPLRMDEQVLLKIALTMQIGAMVSMPIPSYYYEYLTPKKYFNCSF
jgi:hypothetical protein